MAIERVRYLGNSPGRYNAGDGEWRGTHRLTVLDADGNHWEIALAHDKGLRIRLQERGEGGLHTNLVIRPDAANTIIVQAPEETT